MKKILTILLSTLFTFSLPAQDYAIKQLEKSPRHHEWVDVSVGEKRVVHCFVAYPEKKENTQAVLVIHENRGLNDWARSLTDQLAEKGYLAIAPDLLSGFSEKYDRTADFPTSDEARTGIYRLEMKQVMQDLDSVFNYIKNDPACNGEVSVMGFCWGGSQCFNYASVNPDIKAALVFYGTPPKTTGAYKTIETPVYGFYGGEDQRVNATIPTAETIMKGNDKFYEYVIYPGAGHAFMRRGDDPKGERANKRARRKAWKRIKKILE